MTAQPLRLTVTIGTTVKEYAAQDAVNILLWVVRTWMKVSPNGNLDWPAGKLLMMTATFTGGNLPITAKANHNVSAMRSGGLKVTTTAGADCGCMHKRDNEWRQTP